MSSQDRKPAKLYSLPLAILAATAGTAGMAQEGASSLQEIVVTARRAEESLQSVPVTVTAFDAEEIRKRGITDMEDIQQATPGVHLSGSGTRANPVYQIRGISKALSGTMSPGVVSYFGEVPEPNNGSYIPQYDLASVQVLKGPQGTLFGRNTIGGAILFEAAAPSHEFEGYLNLSVGEYSLRKYEGAVNVPLVQDKLAIRLAGVINKRDGYTDDLAFGREVDNSDWSGFRASLLWTPTENISNTLIYDITETDYNNDGIVPVEHIPGAFLPTIFGLDTDLAAAVAGQNARGPRDVFTTRGSFSTTDKVIINNRTEIQLGDLTLVNIFGYRDIELNTLNNSDGLRVLTADGSGAFPAGTPVEYIKSRFRRELEQYSNEIQLKGLALNDKLDWQVGAFWLEAEPTGPQADWVAFAAVAGTSGRPTAFNFTTEESKALYAHGTYDLSAFVDGLDFEVGVRHTWDDIESCTGTGFDDSTNVDLSACENNDTSQLTGAAVTSSESEETTWSVGLNWQINPDHFAYIVSRHGYRAGGINSPSLSGRLAEFQSFEPETVTDVEVGLRSDWTLGDVALRTNISAFAMKGKDVQAPVSGVTTAANCAAVQAANPGQPVPPPTSPDGTCTPGDDPAGNTLMINQGDSKISGADVELTIVPIENLNIRLSGSYLDVETDTFNKPAALAPYIGAANEIRFEFVAEKTATASVAYTIPVDNQSLQNVTLRGDYYWTDDRTFAGNWLIPGYERTNFRVDFEGAFSPSVDLAVWVNNAFDEEFIATGSITGQILGFNAGIFGPPRMWGAEVRYNF
jgi:iron complex outermembrane receptor protein